MPTLSLRVNERENDLIREFAEFRGQSINEFVKSEIMSYIEDELDYQEAVKLNDEFEKNPKTREYKDIIEDIL